MKRFFDKVDKTEDCWNWTASSRGQGYGAFKINGKVIDAHRVSWTIHFGEIPNGLFVCHKCDNKKCVNPDHLFLGTQKDNMNDCLQKGRMIIPEGIKYKEKHKPVNRSLKNEVEISNIKLQIKNRSCTLKQLSENLNLPYQLIRDISCGRVYK